MAFELLGPARQTLSSIVAVTKAPRLHAFKSGEGFIAQTRIVVLPEGEDLGADVPTEDRQYFSAKFWLNGFDQSAADTFISSLHAGRKIQVNGEVISYEVDGTAYDSLEEATAAAKKVGTARKPAAIWPTVNLNVEAPK